jgi:alpha-beta hydrolase superfamily lysophospholipase
LFPDGVTMTPNPLASAVRRTRTVPRPVLFIHGLFLHASSWGPWCRRFAEAGFAPVAPGWPGEADTVAAARATPESVANQGIEDVQRHFRAIVAELTGPPVLVGHSFGGLIVQKLIGEGLGCAGVAIDPAQIRGVLPLPLAQLRSGWPILGNPFNLTRAVSLTREEFRYGFGNALPAAESDELFETWTIPSPARPVFEAAVANFVWHAASEVDTLNATRGPLLLVSGADDHTVPEVTTRATYHQYRRSRAITELIELEGRGHSLTIDHGWEQVAETVLEWLSSHGIGNTIEPAEPASAENDDRPS